MDYKTYFHLFMDKHASIVDRLLFVMDGRDKYPWGQSIGLGKGVIDGMTRTGSIPGGETLMAIRKCENVRIDWLLEGSGEPYITTKALNDTDAVEYLEELMTEKWSLYILTDQLRLAVVLVQSGKFQVKDGKDDQGEQKYKWIEYPIVEIVVGIFGNKTVGLLQRLAAQQQIHLTVATTAEMSALEKGMLGTYQLTKRDGLLSRGIVIPENHPLFKHAGQQSLIPYSAEEIDMLDSFRAISQEDKQALTRVINAMRSDK